MGLFDVVLGIDKAAKDTGVRLQYRILARDRFSAAMVAEGMADRTLKDPGIEYSHAMKVTPVNQPAATALAMAA